MWRFPSSAGQSLARHVHEPMGPVKVSRPIEREGGGIHEEPGHLAARRPARRAEFRSRAAGRHALRRDVMHVPAYARCRRAVRDRDRIGR